MTVDLEALRALERAATPGPWELELDKNDELTVIEARVPLVVGDGLRSVVVAETTASFDPVADAALIHALRNAFPAMADEIERLRAALEQAAGSVRRAAVFRRSIEAQIATVSEDVEYVRELLTRAREHIDGEIDVIDGDYGEPHPNAAMILASAIDAALGEAR